MSGQVVIVGAGAAGMAAAISAARQGASVRLIEGSERVGGTVVKSLIHTIAGLYDHEGKLINGGLSEELVGRLGPEAKRRRQGRAWTLSTAPGGYLRVAQRWLSEHARLQIACGLFVTEAKVEGKTVTKLGLSDGSTLTPTAVVDATGGGHVVKLLDPRLVHPSPPVAGGVVMVFGEVDPTIGRFPRGLELVRAIRRAVDDGALPELCRTTWVDQGTRDGEMFVKTSLPQGAPPFTEPLSAWLLAQKGFEEATLTQVGELGIRASSQIEGETVLTEQDVRKGRRFEDGVARSLWPMEHWDPEKGPIIEYLSTPYDIPLRALKVRGMENVWAAGRCLSAEPKAQASARVVGTCWAMGEAVGRSAGG